MSHRAVSLSLSIAALLFATTIVVLLLLRDSGHSSLDELRFSIQDLEQRLDHFDDSLDSRLREIADSTLRRGRVTGGETGAGALADAAGDAGEAPEDGSIGSADDTTELLLARLDVLERRLRSLEEDPIQRGYNFLDSDSPNLRRDGIYALERIAKFDPEARAAIRDMLQDLDPGVRLSSLDTIGDLADREAIPVVRPLLDDEDPNVRREAINTLVRLQDKDAGLAIAEMVGDENDKVREMAADAVGRLKSADAERLLYQALDDKNERVRGEAIASFGEIGAKSAIPRLMKMYAEDPGPHKIRLIHSLKNLGEPGPFRQEVNRLSNDVVNNQDERARSQAVRTLSWLARGEAKEVLQQALQDPSERVRREAERALRGGRDRGRGR